MEIGDRLRNLVKIFAGGFISVALGLELWNVVAAGSLFHQWPIIFYGGRLALIAHGLEAIIAGCYAPSRGRSPWNTGIYTFFVGTLALVELFEQPPELDQH